jgi:hypothetical protein
MLLVIAILNFHAIGWWKMIQLIASKSFRNQPSHSHHICEDPRRADKLITVPQKLSLKHVGILEASSVT